MKHPRLEGLIEVPDAAVNGHMLSGWRVTDPPPRPTPLEGQWDGMDPDAVSTLERDMPEGDSPGAKYAAAVEARPDIKSELDGKEK
jgi:hypothetical protein